jgi:hypothetical protein
VPDPAIACSEIEQARARAGLDGIQECATDRLCGPGRQGALLLETSRDGVIA